MMTTNICFIEIPHSCPICNSELKFDTSAGNTVNLICPNKDCQGKLLNRLDHLCSKKGLEIKGLSKATLDKLIDWGFVNRLSDVFSLSSHRDEWIEKDGFGVKSVDKILNEISKTIEATPLDKFLCAIGIPMISQGTMKDLLQCIDSYEDLREKVNNNFDFSIIPNFGAVMSDSVKNFDYTEADIMAKIINIVEPEKKQNVSQKLNGFSFVITGKLKEFKNRQSLVDDIVANGGKVGNSVTKTTDYLIANMPEDTVKYNKAVSYNIPIITEEDYINRRFLNEEQ